VQLEEALGPEVWATLEKTQNVTEARDVLAGMPIDTQGGMLDAIGRDHIMTIASWT